MFRGSIIEATLWAAFYLITLHPNPDTLLLQAPYTSAAHGQSMVIWTWCKDFVAHDTALCSSQQYCRHCVPPRHSPAKHSHRPASDYYSQSSGCSAMDWFLHSVGHKQQAHQQTTSNQPHQPSHPVPVPQLHVRVHASMHSRQHVSLALFLPVAAAVIAVCCPS
jgi:hypothetical protein